MLKGTSVYLREWEVRDLDQLFLWNEHEELYLFNGRYKFATPEDLMNNFLGVAFSQKIVVIEKGKKPIGLASWWDCDHRNRNCEVYAKIYDALVDPNPHLTESLEIITRFLFTHENVSRIYTHISDPCDPILGVLEKMDFFKEGTLREHRFIKGHYVDTQVYAALARQETPGTPGTPGTRQGEKL